MSHIHSVQYYETDKMGITHHSNYIRWMEEARIAFLAEIGWEFAKLEKMGIISPVLNVTCDFKKPTTFSEKIAIRVSIEQFKGVKLLLAYEMRNETGDIVCIGTSAHAFLDTEGRPIKMKRDYPDLFEALSKQAHSASEES